MKRYTRYSTATVLTSIALAQAAQADVTADDVLENLRAYMTAFGAQVTTSTERDGNTLSVTDTSLLFALPLGSNSATVTLNNFDMIENGDGTVSFVYPEVMKFGIEARNSGTIVFSGSFEVESEDYTQIASGNRGDVEYEYTIGSASYRLTGLEFEGANELDVEFTATMSDLAGTSRIVEGRLMEIASESAMGAFGYDMRMVDAEGIETKVEYSFADSVTQSAIQLPTENVNILNLSDALRDGLTAEISVSGDGYSSRTSATAGEALTMSQNMGFGSNDATYTLDETGLTMRSTASDITFDVIAGPQMPVPFNGKIGLVSMDMTSPLNKSDELQVVAMATTFEGFEMSEELWGMFDPAQILPRAPASVSFDVSGKLQTLIDFLNFPEFAMRANSNELPIELHSLALNNLDVDMVGVRLIGEGDFTFDNADMTTFPGMPRPEGAIDLKLVGANGLLDKLVQMGLLPEDQAMGARMMMGLFAVQGDSEDTLNSKIEVNDQGHVLANGQRLK